MNAKISEAIMKHYKETGDIKAAVDAVLGAGTYEKIAGEIYEALRA